MNALELSYVLFPNHNFCITKWLKKKTVKEAWESWGFSANNRESFLRRVDELNKNHSLMNKLKHVPVGKKKNRCKLSCWCAGNGPQTRPGISTMMRLISFEKDIEPKLGKIRSAAKKKASEQRQVQRRINEREKIRVRKEKEKIAKKRRLQIERGRKELISYKIREMRTTNYRRASLIKKLPSFGTRRINTLWRSIYR